MGVEEGLVSSYLTNAVRWGLFRAGESIELTLESSRVAQTGVDSKARFDYLTVEPRRSRAMGDKSHSELWLAVMLTLFGIGVVIGKFI